jgi:transposase-like protein
MRTKTHYTQAFREQALEKVYARGDRTVVEIAEELNMSPWTLKNWMKPKKKDRASEPKSPRAKRPNDHSRAERLQLLMQSHDLEDEALNAYCREKGIFAHQLKQWRTEFETGAPSSDPAQLRELKEKNKSLERDLKRKDKALAEAAALLVLQKKYQALWEDKDE